MKKFAPKPIDDPLRPSSSEITAAIAPLAGGLIPTPLKPPVKAEPVLMMSFKASKSFARTLAHAAEPEGGLRRLIARVFAEAGYDVPQVDLTRRKRRTYD